MKSSHNYSVVAHSPLLAQAQACKPITGEAALAVRMSIKPMAILDVVRRRGRSWGLLAQYEEGRLGLSR
ncbi:hypothetical protein C0V76_15125 [Uliginosibacterium sp. TH139]|nr:hypothetical protein C0V76_15125 [Uliginosibacterium sp. TH139]